MKRVLVCLLAVEGLLLAASGAPLRAQDVEAPTAGDPARREPITWLYRIQKRAGGGRFIGWFLDVDSSVKPENDQAAALATSWSSKPKSVIWEIRPAGEFNGVDCVYLLNKGPGTYSDWFVAIDENTGNPILTRTASPTTTKWVIRWVGRSGKYDLYQFRNAGLSKFTGAYLGLTEEAQHETGMAQNIVLYEDGRHVNTFWTLQRQPVEEEEFEEITPPGGYYGY